MNVERLKDGVFRIDLGATDWSDLVSRLNQAWPTVRAGQEGLVRAKPGWKWDRLRAYVRFDSDFIWFRAGSHNRGGTCSWPGSRWHV